MLWLAIAVLLVPGRAARAAEAGPKDAFVWPAWQIPAQKLEERGALSIQPDPDAETEREVQEKGGAAKKEKVCLRLQVSRRSIAKSELPVAVTPMIKWADVKPGLYRVSARVKYVGDECIIGTPINLGVDTINRDTQTQPFYSFDMEKGGQYGVISFLYEVDPTGQKRLKARQTRHAWHYAAYLTEDYPEAKKLKMYQPPGPRDYPGLQVHVRLPQTRYSAETGMPPNSLQTVSLDWVKLERVQPAGLTVRYVRAQKRWLRPGEKTSFDVAVGNFTAQPWERSLVLTLARGMDERTALHTETVALKPGESKKITVPWETTANTPIWGYEVVAELRDGEKVDSSSRDFFSVHPEVYTVHLMGTRFRTVDTFREEENCANLVEVFSATTGDCAKAVSDHDQFLGGMSTVAQAHVFIRNCTNHNRSMGVATHAYLFAGGTSTHIIDLYVRKPEWFSSRVNATDEIYRAIAKTGADVAKHDFNTGPFEMPKIPHIEEGMNHFFPELMDKITRETIDFLKKTGYDGIRFDVGIFAPKGVTTVFGQKLDRDAGKIMQYAADNFNKYRDAIRKEFPYFEFGANMDSWAYLEFVGKRDGPKPPPPEDYPEFVAFAKAHGMFMDEGTMSAPIFGHYMNRFEDALWGMCQKREVARRYGGVYQLFSPHRDGYGHFAHDDCYWAIMIIASGSYYVGNFSAMPYSRDAAGQFITRYAEFFRDMRLVPIPNVGDQVFVDSPSELWYKDAAVQADLGGKLRYVIPLINPPVNDRFRRNKSNTLPPPILAPFDIEIKLPEGYKRAKAWMLTWEPTIQSVPLEAKAGADNVRVKFPGIQLFRTLVVEFEM